MFLNSDIYFNKTRYKLCIKLNFINTISLINVLLENYLSFQKLECKTERKFVIKSFICHAYRKIGISPCNFEEGYKLRKILWSKRINFLSKNLTTYACKISQSFLANKLFMST